MASEQGLMTQAPIRTKGSYKCPNHHLDVVFSCMECTEELVCPMCVTTIHKHHEIVTISQTASNKKEKIQEYIGKSESTEIPEFSCKIQFTEDKIKENADHFNTLKHKIKSQGERMKAEIDRITNELLEECQILERNNDILLSLHKEELENLRSQLCDRVDMCKEAVDSEDAVLIIDEEREINYNEIMKPDFPPLQTADFTSGEIQTAELQNFMGGLSLQEEQTIAPSYRITDSTVLSKFKHSALITSIEKSTSDCVWVSYCYDESISLVNQQGQVKQEATHDYDISDISVSPITGNLWLSCYDDKAIYELTGLVFITPTNRFITDQSPLSLCATQDNTVVVGTGLDVIVYTTTGEVLFTTQHSDEHLVIYPYHITACNSTGDIAVCDRAVSSWGGDDMPCVTVLDATLDQKYRYNGLTVSRHSHVSMSSFYPFDVVYDTEGRLLVADYNNKCIHLISDEGQIISIVHTDQLHPTALTLIDNGKIYVSFNDRTMKLIQYEMSIHPIQTEGIP